MGPGENRFLVGPHAERSGASTRQRVSNYKDLLYTNEGHTLKNAHSYQTLKTTRTDSSILLMLKTPSLKQTQCVETTCLVPGHRRQEDGSSWERWHPGQAACLWGLAGCSLACLRGTSNQKAAPAEARDPSNRKRQGSSLVPPEPQPTLFPSPGKANLLNAGLGQPSAFGGVFCGGV